MQISTVKKIASVITTRFFFYGFILIFPLFMISGCKDECEDVNCLNGGLCSNGNCICASGFTGKLCEEAVDPCKSYPCANGATVASGGSCTCVCDTGFYGADCSLEDFCITDSTVCLNGGTCDPATGLCICATGFEDDSCQTLVNAKFIGSYKVTETCSTTTGNINLNYNSSINPGLTGERVFVSNINNRAITIEALIYGLSIQLTEQPFGVLEIQGGNGNYHQLNNSFTLIYSFTTSGGDNYACSAEFVKQ